MSLVSKRFMLKFSAKLFYSVGSQAKYVINCLSLVVVLNRTKTSRNVPVY